MSYSSLIQVLPEAWRSSTGLAALASVGIHLVLVAVLPYVPFDSQDHLLQQTVGVVALTPEEQSRLPQIDPTLATIPSTAASGQSDLPPLPAPGQAFQSDILPPLPPPTPSFLPPPPPINAPGYQYPVSNSLPPAQIPTVPVPLPPPPENRSLISQSPFSQLPPPEPNQNIRTQQLTPLPPNAIPPNRSLPPTSGLKPGEALSPPPPNLSSSQRQNTTQTQNQVAINNRSLQQTPAQARSGLPERTKQELIARRDAIRRERLAANKTLNSDSGRNQRLAAALQRRQQQSSSAATNTPTSDTQRLAAALQRRQQNATTPRPSTSNRLSTATTQTIAQIDAFKQQQQKVQQDFPTAALQAPIRYKIKTCDKQLDGGVAILAAVVSPQGKIISGPDLVSKNSSIAMRRAAKKFIKNYQFPKTTNTVNQPFRLDFSYDFGNCPVTTQPRRSKS